MRHRFLLRFSILVVLLPLLGVACIPSVTQPAAKIQAIQFRVASDNLPPAPVLACGMDTMTKELAGKFDVKVFHSAQLGQAAQVLQIVKAGEFEASMVGAGQIQPFYAPMGVFSAIYVIDDADHMSKVIGSPVWTDLMKGLAEKANLAIPASLWYGTRQLTTSKKPIRTPEDMAGLKMRVAPGSQVAFTNGRAMGANPTTLPFGELYLGLSQGVVEAQENPLPTIDEAKFYEVQQFLNLTNHEPSPQFLVVNSKWYADLSADYRDLCERLKPDFVFALGRHADMAAQGEYLVERGIPFAMEKPCGLNAAEVGPLADHAARRGAFAAVPFVWRQTGFMDVVNQHAAGDTFEYLALRIVSGHPDRYVQAGCPWMYDPALSGGGATLNLAVHLIDLFRALTGTRTVDVTSAQMANTAFGLQVEDWSLMVMRAGNSYCSAETGFLYPAPTGIYDIQYTIKTDRHYIFAGPEITRILDTSGNQVQGPTLPANDPTYAFFVQDVLRRYRAGEAPLTGLADMLDVIQAVDRAYDLAWPPVVQARGAASKGRPSS